ncbi:MAG TPA: methyltransferase domain-containing protein [Anaerolineales bacterium]|nr:methyltransferase domain-containing protein [Anaerolineales bacterium]
MTADSQNKKDTLQGVFTRSASSYGQIRYFPIFGEWLVETAQIPQGATVLDVACGRGAVLFPAAERVGPGGRVIGIDLAEGMARETQMEIERRGLKHAEARQMDAENLTFPDSTFDFVLCGFSMQFFPHLEQALTEFKRVLRPSGHVAVTTWGADDERWDWYEDLRTDYGATISLGSQSLDKPDEIQDWFSKAGFVDIQIHTKEIDLAYRDEEEWWNVLWSISGRAGLEKIGAEKLEQLKAEAFEKMQAQKEADGFHHRLEAFCTFAARE